MKNLIKYLCLIVSITCIHVAYAQTKTVTGKVINDQDSILANASIIIKNTNIGGVTNADGSFSINVPDTSSTLVVSSAGYLEQEVTITESPMTIILQTELGDLDEVVVVGYGTQKRSNITGAISSVRSKDIENIPSGRVEQALQGRASGVTIMQNSGQPGSSSTIRVRGVTTFGDAGNNPLWVVDGVVVDAGGIGYLNQSDIESIEVLKDAASAAIYGTRAATGVVLVTTKKGKAGSIVVNYNGSYGTSSTAKKLDLLNASQYATLLNEAYNNAGITPRFSDPNALGNGTDWQDVIFNNANRYSHEVSLSGGSDKSTFYLSAGINGQEGIVLKDISDWTKKSIRLNSTHKISKVFTLGEAVGYTHQKTIGIGNTNNEYGGPLSSAVNLDPTTPVIETDPQVLNSPPYTNPRIVRDENGNAYGISSLVLQEMANPLAYQQTRMGQYNWSDDIIGNTYLEAAITNDLKVRSTLGGKLSYWGFEGFTPEYLLNTVTTNSQNNYRRETNKSFNWNIENTITYSKNINDHNFTVLLGQGAYVEKIGGNVGAILYNLPITNYKDASFRFSESIPEDDKTTIVNDLIEHRVTSLFARVNYAYRDKYLFTGIIRRDGSSRFGINKKYGYFPSFSAGWVVTKEDFLAGNNTVNFLKIRGGYGVVGNDNLDDNRFLSTVRGGNNYPFGTLGSIIIGYTPLTLDNPDLHWEQTSQANIGFDAQLFRTINLTIDVYNKKTSGILRQVNIPGYVGVQSKPWANIADMANKGIDIELGYTKRFGDFGFSANGNMSLLKNEVTSLDIDADFAAGDASFQSMGSVTRIQVGQPYNAFFGYKTNGIFQNQAEIDNYKNADGGLIQPDAKPGDFRWMDINGDGIITNDDQDKTFLGSSIPKVTYGLTLNFDYKGFDLMLFAQGAGGNMIFQGLRRLDMPNNNWQTKALDRWTGEGTSNTYPRLVYNSDPNGNFSRMSDFYLEKGNYLRMKVLQLGYTIPRNTTFQRLGISRLRVYLTTENLFTITGYTGYDPEVGGGVLGIDKGQYPQARSFIGGLQIQF